MKNDWKGKPFDVVLWYLFVFVFIFIFFFYRLINGMMLLPGTMLFPSVLMHVFFNHKKILSEIFISINPVLMQDKQTYPVCKIMP